MQIVCASCRPEAAQFRRGMMFAGRVTKFRAGNPAAAATQTPPARAAMRWEEGRESENVEDRRGMPGGPVMMTGGIGTLIVIVLALVFGIDPQALLGPPGGMQPPGAQQPGAGQPGPGPAGAEDELKHF